MTSVYIARNQDGTILGVFNRLDILHCSHVFSNHKREDVLRYEHNGQESIVYYKDGSKAVVKIEHHPIYETIEHL